MGGQSSDRSGPSLGSPSVTSQPPPPPPAATAARPPTSVSARHHQYSLPPPSLESLAAPNIQLQGRDEWALPQDDAMIGKWQAVSTPGAPKDAGTKKVNDKAAAATTHDQAPEFQDDDEDQEEDLNEFKIKEKEYPLDHQPPVDTAPADSTGLFKKRKLGGEKGNMAAKKRMIRKKNDT